MVDVHTKYVHLSYRWKEVILVADPLDPRRTSRLDLRLTDRQKAAFQEAARDESQALSAFIIQAAEERTARLLSERTEFVLDANKWDLFSAALDRPAVVKSSLRRLMDSTSVFEEA